MAGRALRRAYEAFNTGDVNTLTELFDESAVWGLDPKVRQSGETPAYTDYIHCVRSDFIE